MLKKFLITSVFFVSIASNSFAKDQDLPSFFTKPRKNNIDVLYGVGEGATLEEATKNALSDTAGKLVVTISSESQVIKEENQNSYNEELRQKVKQSIEKISFTGYEVSKSEQVGNRFYVEVSVER
ncbi:MAG: LPP20 family lipoprotein, partial [Alphaproteobacteria bacterium]